MVKHNIIIGVIVFLVGIVIGRALSDVYRTQETTAKPKQVTVVESKQDDWKKLKAIDDKIISSCSYNFGVVSEIFNAQVKGDYATVKSKNELLNAGATDATNYAEERNIALKKLGY
jgi:hypothetical protein